MKPRRHVRFRMLPWQAKELPNLNKYRFNVWNCGIFTGKTSFGTAIAIKNMIKHKNETSWWICPEAFQIERFWEEAGKAVNKFGWRAKVSPYVRIKARNGSTLMGITAKNLNKISAFHPDRIYIDEAAKLTKAAWNLIRIRMTNCKSALLMSTTRANYWRDLVKKGKDPNNKEYSQTTVTTYDAGILSTAEIEQLKDDIPHDLFQQEVYARFVSEAGKVFRNVEECATGDPLFPESKVEYIVTQDYGKLHDFGVISVWEGLKLIYCERFELTDYGPQAERAIQICHEYNKAPLIFDATGVGEAVGEMLATAMEKYGEIDTVPIVFNNVNKSLMVQAAQVAFEHRRISLIDSELGEPYDVFNEELMEFERNRSKSGLVYTYNAPAGEHDDCVTTLLLRMSAERQTGADALLAHKRKQAADRAGGNDGR